MPSKPTEPRIFKYLIIGPLLILLLYEMQDHCQTILSILKIDKSLIFNMIPDRFLSVYNLRLLWVAMVFFKRLGGFQPLRTESSSVAHCSTVTSRRAAEQPFSSLYAPCMVR